MSKIHNFSAGPSILAESAFEKSIEDIRNFAGTGLSILEVSHRGKEFENHKAVDVFFNLENLKSSHLPNHRTNKSNISHLFEKDRAEQVFRPGRKLLGGPSTFNSNYNLISNEKQV